MTKSFIPVWALALLLTACTTMQMAQNLSVDQVFENSEQYDQSEIRLAGHLEFDTNVINIIGSKNDHCIGLLLTRAQIDNFRKKSGQRIVLQGTVDAKGCAGNNICFDHLCGPVLLTEVKELRR